MNLDELRAVRDDERESGELQPLRPSFYGEARSFVEELEEERNRQFEASDDPLSDPAVERLNDKHNSAAEVLSSIFEHRISKLLTHALTDVVGQAADPPAMTAEEARFYQVVVESIQHTRAAAIEGIDADLPTPPEQEISPDDAEDVEPPSVASEEAPAETDDEPRSGDRILVHIVETVGTILGVDEREYDLAAGDVVSLPVENARALIEREVAEQVEE